jgi:hypothetical protein
VGPAFFSTRRQTSMRIARHFQISSALPPPASRSAARRNYVDFDELSRTDWKKLLPVLERARAILSDFRGYTSGAGFAALGHITDREIASPIWEIPNITGQKSSAYFTAQWRIFPASPRLAAKIIMLVDGQSMSAVETILQMFHDNHLGRVVGETSGGTNGNVSSFRVPGGFEIYFTGMRVARADGSTIQGRGITPDQVVHPTLDGVRAGRDEVLEAAVAAALRLIGP